jgi:hypothetical protein
MRDKLLRMVASLFAVKPAPPPPDPGPAERLWIGRELEDPEGVVIGRVIAARPDPVNGAWIELRSDWGPIEWISFGWRHPSYSFHSDDIEETAAGHLRLKAAILAYRIP